MVDAERIRCQRCGLACGAGVHRRGDFTEKQQALMSEVMHPVMDFHDPVPDPVALALNEALGLLKDAAGHLPAQTKSVYKRQAWMCREQIRAFLQRQGA